MLPILSYGHTTLREKCDATDPDLLDWNILIDDMWETLDSSGACGLSAPQINLPVQLFIVDTQSYYQNLPADTRDLYFENGAGIRETFINPRLVNRSTRTWIEFEGCLSIPGISEKVERHWDITIEYLDRSFLPQRHTYSGMNARAIQHEYDHTLGVLYLDHLKPVRRNILDNKLARISEGAEPTLYPMVYPRKP